LTVGGQFVALTAQLYATMRNDTHVARVYLRHLILVVLNDAFDTLGHTHGRPHIGAMGSADPPGKMDEKLKSENTQKLAVFYVYVIF